MKTAKYSLPQLKIRLESSKAVKLCRLRKYQDIKGLEHAETSTYIFDATRLHTKLRVNSPLTRKKNGKV